MKKLCSIFLALMLIASFTITAPAAEKVDFIRNGSFETLLADGTPESWVLLGEAPEGGTIETKGGQDGNNAVMFKADSGNLTYTQRVEGLLGGTEYTLTAYLHAKAIYGSGAQIKLEFYAGDVAIDTVVKESYTDITKKYEPKVITFNAPDGATRANVLIRLLGGGEVYWDNISMTGAGKPVADASGKAEFIRNGGFEEITAEGTPASWTLLGEPAQAFVDTKTVQEGSNAVLFKADSGNLTYTQRVDGLVGDTEYVFTAYLYAKGIYGSGAQVKLEFYAGDVAIDTVVKESYTDITKKYEPKVITFTAPSGATRANVLIRLLGGGEAMWDGISLKGQLADGTQTPAPAPQKPAQPSEEVEAEAEDLLVGVENLLRNPGFEDVDQTDGYGPWYWQAYKADTWKDNQKTFWDTEKVHSGTKSVKITNDDPNDNPFTRMTVDVLPGAKYQIGGYIWADKSPDDLIGGFIAVKLEFNNAEGTAYNEANPVRTGGTNGQWMPFAASFETPADATKLTVILRQRNVGTVWFDDVQLCFAEMPNEISIVTDEVFYYTDHADPGLATVTMNTVAYPELLNKASVNMVLKKGDTVLAQQANVPLYGGVATWSYDVALLTEKQAEYTIEASVDGLVGTALIYKYDRPKFLGADGILRDKNGNPIQPVTAYRYRDYQYEMGLTQAGITIGQLAMPADKEGDALVAHMKAALDAAEAKNTKVMIALYRNGKPAGDDVNIKTTELIVSTFKDHNALAAWMVMDETFNNVPNPYEVLRKSYIAIRNNDPYHPVYICEATTKLVDAGKYVDILCVDPYPGNHSKPETFPQERVQLAIEAVKGRKPVWSLLQAIPFQEYTPTEDEMRNMLYQSFFAGADGVGYYKFDDSIDKLDLNETHWWPVITDFAKYEQNDAFKAFVYGEYPIFSDVRLNDSHWAISYIKNNELYVVVQNRTAEAKEVDIALTSIAGDITLGDYTGVCAFGGEGEAVSGNGTLHAKLRKSGVSVYKLTPSDASVFANVPKTNFKDIATHGWAYNAIINMAAKNIVTGISGDSYFPAQKITRGDYAMFLVRALGITADAGENFVDVAAGAHYAKELAIGRAAGIINGVGENRFNPEAAITRQDMMTMTSRAMKLAGTADLSSFSDAGSIADYAASHVSAMVAAGLIKGNADGTINPLGNTTRAEAAVIMSRIGA